ncbi:AAA family ATPase [Actinomyces sp.]|uniref:AAA family ATPase n=1 Tax=Actinomyces sp. TaxID=29317 RepID=UPI0026DAE9C2|nr:AAA family ATPase [Actinomyces sp.]MDO4900568.1 AAA family ATPase [Actinomyces sp.]
MASEATIRVAESRISDESAPAGCGDPRALLAEWANDNQEWLRSLVAEVIARGRPVEGATIDNAYQLFRQENGLDVRLLPAVDKINVTDQRDESLPSLYLTRISEVHGVNALAPGAVIEPHEGLTILYGENGTGKTGYSRIFKALANSRTAEEKILGNVETESLEEQSAKLEYKLGDEVRELIWRGEYGVWPFTRMSVFDSPSVTTHIDSDLDYVYTPASLALFEHVTAAIQAVERRINDAIHAESIDNTSLLTRFHKNSTIYPLIETLGPNTDLENLKARAATGADTDANLERLDREVSELRANVIDTKITTLKIEKGALTQAIAAADMLVSFDANEYNASLARLNQLESEYAAFRDELFAAADLPAEPDGTWSQFVQSGEAYRQHLVELEVHEPERCLYCRQPLQSEARDLLSKYSKYLKDKISTDIRSVKEALEELRNQVRTVQNNEVATFLNDGNDSGGRPQYLAVVGMIESKRSSLAEAVDSGRKADTGLRKLLRDPRAEAAKALRTIDSELSNLEKRQHNREQALSEKQVEYVEYRDAVELGRSWELVKLQVENAKGIDRLYAEQRRLPQLRRAVTELTKKASEQLTNQSFDQLFREECEALRAPEIKLKFTGSKGKALRRKIVSGKHRPSRVLSEGEQKVLALADFLAEARMSRIAAPIVFDDPVSSLDHRRVKEVAQRIAQLTSGTQVIVFSHDILFVATLLSMFEKSKRCTYFHVTDDDGKKGKVTRATGPRWDTLGFIKGKINGAIQNASNSQGDRRDQSVREGYDWLRSWCEVFVEMELLRGVTQRYQPNVAMTRLARIDTSKLNEIIPKVMEIFEEACRYIDAHSQPLVTLSVAPTLEGLVQRWEELQALKRLNDGK